MENQFDQSRITTPGSQHQIINHIFVQITPVMRTFVLPDILPGYKASSCFYYEYRSDETNSRSKIHFTTHCISLVLSGIKHMRSTKGVESFAKGSVLLFSPGNYVSYEIKENSSIPYKSILLFFSSELIGEFFAQLEKTEIIEPAKDHSPYFSLGTNDYLLHYAETLTELLDGKNKFSDALQKFKLLELLAYLYTKNSTSVSGLLNQNQLPASDASLLKVIENNIHSDLTIEDLAFLCNMSLSTFKRWFEKQYGESPGKLIKQKRLEQAANQIKFFRKNPTEIFTEAGYADYSSFSHSFKRQFGVCPKEYRQQMLS